MLVVFLDVEKTLSASRATRIVPNHAADIEDSPSLSLIPTMRLMSSVGTPLLKAMV